MSTSDGLLSCSLVGNYESKPLRGAQQLPVNPQPEAFKDLQPTLHFSERNPKIQQQAIALGGTVTYVGQAEEAPLPVQAPVPRVSGRDVEDNGAWEYWKQLIVLK